MQRLSRHFNQCSTSTCSAMDSLSFHPPSAKNVPPPPMPPFFNPHMLQPQHPLPPHMWPNQMHMQHQQMFAQSMHGPSHNSVYPHMPPQPPFAGQPNSCKHINSARSCSSCVHVSRRRIFGRFRADRSGLMKHQHRLFSQSFDVPAAPCLHAFASLMACLLAVVCKLRLLCYLFCLLCDCDCDCESFCFCEPLESRDRLCDFEFDDRRIGADCLLFEFDCDPDIV